MNRYTVVHVKPEDVRVIERALYAHTRVAGAEHNVSDGGSAGKSVLVLETWASTEADANYLGNYQADRLRSFGSFYVTSLFDTYTEAEWFAGEELDAYPEMVHAVSPRLAAARSLAAEFATDVSEWTV